jgi:hypothetical protein
LVATLSAIVSTRLIINLHRLFESCALIYKFSFQKLKRHLTRGIKTDQLGQVRVDTAVLLELLLTYSIAATNSHLKQNTELQIYFLFPVLLQNSQYKVKMGYMFWLNKPSLGL